MSNGSIKFPVECAHCGAVYDTAQGEVVARYADCTMFKTPCCGRTVDDRSWKSLPDYHRLGGYELAAFHDGRHVDGRFRRTRFLEDVS